MKVLVISDMHMPYQHPDAFDFLRDEVKKVKPDVVVAIGDLADCHAFSRFEKSPEAWNAAEELRRLREGCAELDKIFGQKCQRLACIGNHETRIYKRMRDANLPMCIRKGFNEMFGLREDWHWMQRHIVDSVVYDHGSHVPKNIRRSDAGFRGGMSAVYGDRHELHEICRGDDTLSGYFVASTGCLVDCQAPVFDYRKEYRNMPLLGTVAVCDGEPRLLFMKREMTEKTRFPPEDAWYMRAEMIDAERYKLLLQKSVIPQKPSPRGDPTAWQREEERLKDRRERLYPKG